MAKVAMTDGRVIMHDGKVGGDAGYCCCRDNCDFVVEYSIEALGYGNAEGTATPSGGWIFFDYFSYDSYFVGSVYFECDYPCFWKVTGYFCYGTSDPGDPGSSEVWEAVVPMENGCPVAGEVPLSAVDPPGNVVITTLNIQY